MAEKEAELYRHAGGGIYEKIAEATLTTTEELVIVYKALVGGRMYVMPAKEFEGVVMYEGEKKLHFEPLKSEKDRPKEKAKA